MSMLCSLYRITPEQLTKLKEYPDAVGELLGLEVPPTKVNFISKLFGKSKNAPLPQNRKFEPVTESNTFELNQAWHILHYLFSGEVEEGEWPAAFIMYGGEEVGPDLGYGPTRLFTPALLQDIVHFIGSQTIGTLDEAYRVDNIDAAQVYWQASSEPSERQRQVDELWCVVKNLQVFCEQTYRAGNSLLIEIY